MDNCSVCLRESQEGRRFTPGTTNALGTTGNHRQNKLREVLAFVHSLYPHPSPFR
jgi:hypothetical protein